MKRPTKRKNPKPAAISTEGLTKNKKGRFICQDYQNGSCTHTVGSAQCGKHPQLMHQCTNCLGNGHGAHFPQTCTAEKKRFGNLLAKGRTKFNRFTLRKVMKAWWVDAEDRIRLRRVTDRACRKLDTLKLRHFFREWRDASAEDLGTKAKIRRASKLWGKQVLASAWRSWKSSVNLDRVKQSNARVHFAIKQAVRQER